MVPSCSSAPFRAAATLRSCARSSNRSETFGTASCSRIDTRTLREVDTGCGFVVFESSACADAAIAALADKTVLPDASAPLVVRYAGERPNDANKLYVSMLSLDTNESDLARLFSPFGHVVEVVVLRQKDEVGTSKGSAFVRYQQREDALAAILAMDKRAKDPHSATVLQVRLAHTHEQRARHFRSRSSGSNHSSSHTYRDDDASSEAAQQHFTIEAQQFMIGDMQRMMQEAMAQQQQQSHATSFSPLSFHPSSSLFASHTGAQPANFPQLMSHFFSQPPTTASESSMPFPLHAVASYLPMGSATQTATPNHESHYVPVATMPLQPYLPSTSLPFGVGSATFTPAAVPMLVSDLRGPPGCNVYVCGLPPACTELHLLALFSPFGPVLSVKVQRHAISQVSRGHGFVSFTTPHAARLALMQRDQTEVMGHTITVRLKANESDVAQMPQHQRRHRYTRESRNSSIGAYPLTMPHTPAATQLASSFAAMTLLSAPSDASSHLWSNTTNTAAASSGPTYLHTPHSTHSTLSMPLTWTRIVTSSAATPVTASATQMQSQPVRALLPPLRQATTPLPTPGTSNSSLD